MKPAQTYGSSTLSPWISPSLRRGAAAGPTAALQSACVLLVDDREAFRYTVSAELQRHGAQVLSATGPYDAWHLGRHRHIDLIVIRGNLHSQSGWQCAAKLCGRPPWKGVVMHFDRVSHTDRNWRFAAGLTGLVETGGRPQSVVECILRVLNTLPSDDSPARRSLSVASQS